ncbi:MAG: ribonuclease Y [Trueperaceae bacterium]|nr:ribonuclease Y [Truepera sp.]HRN17594.1 ribonuclease Y [Trueperaceae bacterium]HRQ09875.1 ribonuclease Y [Trueperaceae bacterium]
MNGSVTYVLLLLLGLLIGAVGMYLLRKRSDQNAEAEAQRLVAARLSEAERAARDITDEAKRTIESELARARQTWTEEEAGKRRRLEDELAHVRETAKATSERALAEIERDREAAREARDEARRDRERLEQQEERLNRRSEQQDARALRLDEAEERLNQRNAELVTREEGIEAREAAALAQLHEIAQLSREQATQMILDKLDSELDREKAVRIRGALERADAESRKRSQDILAQAIQRSASEVSAAISVSVVPIPSDAMKGRIIGREGRNIRAFEALTGVDLIIDDTPEAVLLSSFNPMRREVAQLALSELVTDGRIHPARIEEVVHKAQQEMQTYIRERGDEAALEANVVGLKPGLVQLLGRMQFRTSYGQNILKHSVQVAHLSGIIAAELGLDEAMARRAGLLHDIGKSIDREIEGTHTEIGANLGRRFGEPKEVIDAILNHHELDHAETLFPIIVNAADAVSAARPGARRETLESYIKRLEGLETIATSFPGVDSAFAIQAGRELRIIVQPERVDDATAVLLARDVANRIEQDMEYPGQVQVTVVRESRAVEYAR